MRKLLAALLLTALAFATSADLLTCPDGCRDEAPTNQTPAAQSLCPLCHAWGGQPAFFTATPAASPRHTEWLYVPQVRDAHRQALERPPKTA